MLSGIRSTAGKDSSGAVLSTSRPADSRALAAPTRKIPRLRRYRDSGETMSGSDSRGWRSALLGL